MTLNISEILSITLFENTVHDYLVALVVFGLTFIAIKIFKHIVIGRLRRLAKITETELDDLLVALIGELSWTLYLLLPAYIALQLIKTPAIVDNAFFAAILIVITYYVIRGLMHVIDFAKKILIKKRLKEEKDSDTSVIGLLGKVAKGIVWLLAIVFILSNLGYDLSALIAGLGIGGIAVALALQNVLSDVFASFSIYFDKPFKKDDFIIIGDDLGVVEKIGIKSTRIKTLQGEELVVSNKELTETRVHNFKKMAKRRIVFNFGVTYDTPVKKLKKIPVIVKDVINKIKLAELDRAHFKKFGDFSLNFEIVYYIATSDYNKYMDIQQQINLGIKERLEKENIEMAFPTQTIYLNKG